MTTVTAPCWPRRQATPPWAASPLVQASALLQAEHARQVVGVLAWIESRFTDGGWQRGARFGDDGGVCLIGGIDEATGWTQPGVADTVTHELVRRLPAPLRLVGRLRPRLALSLYNDLVGGRTGATHLVAATRRELTGRTTPRGRSAAEAAAVASPAPAAQALARRNRSITARPMPASSTASTTRTSTEASSAARSAAYSCCASSTGLSNRRIPTTPAGGGRRPT
jgi:hypothetical protein